MDNGRLIVNVESVENTLKQLLDKCEIVEKSIKYTKEKLDDSKQYFDTPSATFFRQKVNDLFDEELLKLKNDFVPSIDVLNQVVSLYKEEIHTEHELINKLWGK